MSDGSQARRHVRAEAGWRADQELARRADALAPSDQVQPDLNVRVAS